MFGPWEPDKATLGANNLSVCRNVYAGGGGYLPVKGFSQIAPALSGTFKGGVSFLGPDGSARMLAGSGTNLYSLVSGAWTSILGSLTVNTFWQFAQFGSVAVAVNGGAPIAVNLTANTAAALTGSPPTADMVTVVRDFVVLGRTNGANNMVTWSGFNNHTQWTAGTNQSGFQPMLTGGKITGLTGGEYGMILQTDRIVRMTYTSDPVAPFQFDEVSTNYGCIAEGSVAQAGGIVFCYSRRGFIKIEAGGVTPIGVERVDRTFRAAYTTAALAGLTSAVDPERTLVTWCVANRVWCYNWALDRWSDWDMQAFSIFPSFSASISIDALDALYGNLDAVPYSLDDPRFSGGDPRLTIVANDGTFNVLSGSNLKATFREAPQEPFAGRRARISRVRPQTDAVSGVTLSLTYSQRLGDTQVTDTYTDLRMSGDMPVRTAGRYITPALEIAAGTVWTYAQGIDYAGIEAGGTR